MSLPLSPATHEDRVGICREVLEGLATGDALGEAGSYGYENVRTWVTSRLPSIRALRYTDDTEMASAILEVLVRLKGIDEDVLAWQFRRRFQRDPERGYGKMTRRFLEQTLAGEDWRTVVSRLSGGGSFGNGSAMRAAPVGAYFFDSPAKTVTMATASATVTHGHSEGIAGAVAVALAACVAAGGREREPAGVAKAIFETAVRYVGNGRTAEGIRRAQKLPADTPVAAAASLLGNGAEITCMDTVPFCLWNACRCLHDYQEAILSTIEAGGDCDTNAAIVGGIVAAWAGVRSIPADWLAAREPLRIEGGNS
ncbi:MAG TPA: ADP-ribosylglycohydrolase family protein [Verrucomicrobiales bacterium]|nr:ADP-ribosylglycohydrolase family protein [Verrucomicrobiales bacterium]